jgi:hypothetical protein
VALLEDPPWAYFACFQVHRWAQFLKGWERGL